MRDLTLTPAGPADFDFAYALYRDAIAPLTIELLGRWTDDGQRPVVRAGLAGGEAQLIRRGGAPIGWWQVRQHPDRVDLFQIYLLPEARGQGIGAELIRRLQARGLPVELAVMRNNPARRLYERLGFGVLSEGPYKLLLRWEPGR